MESSFPVVSFEAKETELGERQREEKKRKGVDSFASL